MVSANPDGLSRLSRRNVDLFTDPNRPNFRGIYLCEFTLNDRQFHAYIIVTLFASVFLGFEINALITHNLFLSIFELPFLVSQIYFYYQVKRLVH